MRLVRSRYEAETMTEVTGKMSKVQFERIWIEQCEAAGRVKEHFGLASALDYLVGENLLTFAGVAEQRAEFMQELPDFVQEIRAVFSLEEISEYATQLEFARPFSPFQRNALRAISAASVHVH